MQHNMSRIRNTVPTSVLFWTSLFLLCLVSLNIGGCVCAEQQPSLRSANNNNNEQRHQKRQSVIRRLYGPENGEVRKHVRLLEERSDRSQTGFMGDPSHVVPYENHPYDLQNPNSIPNRRKRKLEDASGASAATNGPDTGEAGGAAYQPMRIRFETQALDDTRSAENAAQIDFLKTQVLPA